MATDVDDPTPTTETKSAQTIPLPAAVMQPGGTDCHEVGERFFIVISADARVPTPESSTPGQRVVPLIALLRTAPAATVGSAIRHWM